MGYRLKMPVYLGVLRGYFARKRFGVNKVNNMSYFTYRSNTLFCEDVPLSQVAKQFGTPCYVYSRHALENNIKTYLEGIAHTQCRICYAVKANSNIAILNIFSKKNMGFDIVSVGELERVLAAKGDPKKIIFSGVGKRSDEILRAIQVGIGCFDIESETELQRINQMALQENTIVNIAIRVNPNIDAGTHPYISTGLNENKFGIPFSDIFNVCNKICNMPNLRLIGLAFHIGSQLMNLEPFLEAIDCLLDLTTQLLKRGISLKHLNFGGGLGVSYQEETPPAISNYLSAIRKKVENCPLEIILEPGRSLVANAGILLTKVEYLKYAPLNNFAIVDAAMNDLIRPALYNAWHDIKPVMIHTELEPIYYDVVGPVCETADLIGKNRQLLLKSGDLLAVMTAGAYGFCMSSNYNSRPRPCEVLIDKNEIHLIRERESIPELFKLEHVL
jgi:diaminopimelate decarboxylase